MSPVIEVRQLHKAYGDTVAVDDISFDVQPGEMFGILGPNGVGKTTTVECIEGLRNPLGTMAAWAAAFGLAAAKFFRWE
jgi:ABC-2 type transport system ATP-binding protein